MYTVRFSAHHPYDSLLRALDILRKMGFRLLGMKVSQAASRYLCEIQFEVSGTLAAHTFVERLRLNEIADLVVEELVVSEIYASKDGNAADLRGASWTFQ